MFEQTKKQISGYKKAFLGFLSMSLVKLGETVKPADEPAKAKATSAFSLARDADALPGAKNYLSAGYIPRLAHFVASVKPPFVFGLEGEWGRGKTFFVTSLASHPVVSSRFAIVTVDAWQAPSDQPLLPFLLNQIGVELRIRSDEWLERIVAAGEAVGKVQSLPATMALGPKWAILSKVWSWTFGWLAAKWRTRAFKRRENLVKDLPLTFDSLLQTALKKQDKETLLVFVDNLDRCLPAAALDLLERLRQAIQSPHCVFIIAYDISVVEDAIRVRYGKESRISARSYLEKIVDLSIQLPPAEPKDFIALLAAQYARYAGRPDSEKEMLEALSSLDKMGSLFRAEFLANPRKWFRIIRQLALYMHLSGATSLHQLLPSILLLLATREYYPALFQLIRKRPDVVAPIVGMRRGANWKVCDENHSPINGNSKEKRDWFELTYGPFALAQDDTAFEICLALGEQMNAKRDAFASSVGITLKDATSNLIKTIDGMSI